MQARAFSFPQLAPGDIAEYQVGKFVKGNTVGSKLYFQSDLPTRHVVFRVKPIPLPMGLIGSYGTVRFTHGCPKQPSKLSKGYDCVEMRDVPAFASEPRMMPSDDVRMWMLFYLTDLRVKPDDFWTDIGTDAATRIERLIDKSSALAGEKAASLTEGVSRPEEKLARLNDYCRQSIVNAVYFKPPAGIDRGKMQSVSHSPDEVIRNRAGNSRDIPALFIAMARSLGFDARVALASSWAYGTFQKELMSSSNLSDTIVAVKVGDHWKFYDPKRCRVSTGTLYYQNEGNMALIATTREIEWARLPVTPAAKSLRKRTARFHIDEEGTLTGTVSIVYSGQALNTALYDYYKSTPSRISGLVGRREKSRIPSCKVTKVKVDGATNLKQQLRLTYEVTVPGYAERAGSRSFYTTRVFRKRHEGRVPRRKTRP